MIFIVCIITKNLMARTMAIVAEVNQISSESSLILWLPLDDRVNKFFNRTCALVD